jgi:two-component system, NtrC family, response regulator AtoC
MEKVLLVEDGLREQRAMAAFLKHRGYEVLVAADRERGYQLLAQIPDIVVTDLKLAGGDGLGVLHDARQALPETPVIITTGHGSIASAVQAMKDGAFDYLTKPINPEELLLAIQRAAERSRLQREVRRLRQLVAERGGLSGMVGNSGPMRQVFEPIHLVAPTRSTVLVTGESGTGKELVAPGPPPPVGAEGRPVRRAELRRHPERPGRERVVRPCQGSVHRRDRAPPRQIRGRRPGNPPDR